MWILWDKVEMPDQNIILRQLHALGAFCVNATGMFYRVKSDWVHVVMKVKVDYIGKRMCCVGNSITMMKLGSYHEFSDEQIFLLLILLR